MYIYEKIYIYIFVYFILEKELIVYFLFQI